MAGTPQRCRILPDRCAPTSSSHSTSTSCRPHRMRPSQAFLHWLLRQLFATLGGPWEARSRTDCLRGGAVAWAPDRPRKTATDIT
jgi:hypothetical protein